MKFLFRVATALVLAATGSSYAQDASDVRFEISRFEVVGNTLLSQAEVDAAVAGYAGDNRVFDDVQHAIDSLELAYRQKGYSLVSIRLPEQELNGGVVKLQVVEARIGHVSVKNNDHFSEANVRKALPALKEGSSPDLRQVSSNVKQSNENPSKQVTLSLQAGSVPDEVDAVVDVKDESPWKVAANAANTGTKSTGRTQLGFALQNSNLFDKDHLATLQYITSAEEPSRVRVYGAGYHIPFYESGDALDMYASYSNVDSGTINAGLLNLAVSGKGSSAGARYSQALRNFGSAGNARSADSKLDSKIVYGIDVKAFKNNVQFSGIQLGNDVTVHPVSIGYQANAPFERGELGALVTLLRNIPGGSNGDKQAFANARTDAKADYTILRLSGSVIRAVANDWQLRAIANGQYTRDALIPGEQFGAGGAASVRGFQEREYVNDSGLSVNLEAYTPNLCTSSGWNCRLLGFVDTAHLSRNKALPGEIDSTTIASVGAGMRFVLSTNANLQLDYGHVTNGGPIARTGSNRLHVRVSVAY